MPASSRPTPARKTPARKATPAAASAESPAGVDDPVAATDAAAPGAAAPATAATPRPVPAGKRAAAVAAPVSPAPAPTAAPVADSSPSLPALRVLHVCAELFPLLKTGGLADVTGALPAALNRHGCEARVLLPGFPAVMAGLQNLDEVARVRVPWATIWGEPAEARLLYGVREDNHSRLGIYVIEAPFLYERPGNPYADLRLQPYGDNHRRFALLGWVGAQLAQGLDPLWQAQCVHSHDWHAGLTSAYLAAARQQRGQRLASSVYTVHNLAYQGLFAPHHLSETALPAGFFGVEGIEFHGQISFMKAGLYYSDRITTVSPTYAREIQTPEQGHGLDGLLRNRARDVRGILNGVDDAVWNPVSDPLIATAYASAEAGVAKAANKAALQALFGVAQRPDAPLLTVVSRLTEQKGLSLVLAGLPELIARGGQLVVLGSGDPALEAAFRAAAATHPESVGVRIGYDEQLSHQVFAGGDVIVVPSRFEPCGLTQLYGLKYGCLPLVRRVGGLADTVVDCTLEDLDEGRATGFVFDAFDSASFSRALRRVFALYARPAEWQAVRRRAMAQDFGWDAAALDYVGLYREIAA